MKNNNCVRRRVRAFSLKNEGSDFEFRALINLKVIFNFLVLKVRKESAAVVYAYYILEKEYSRLYSY
jgi:hypothetical protein